MRLCLIPLLIPACLFAQAPQTASPQAAAPAASAAGSPADAASSPAPPEIDKALRERATSFLQYNMEGNFRKAYDLVAEESKDFYFSQTKPKFSSFKIEDIQYSDNFTAAVVRSAQRRTMTFQGQSFDFDLPATDTWRLVDGKWMWTHQEKNTVVTPFGEFQANSGSSSASPAPGTPPPDTSPDGLKKMASAINLGQPSSVDKPALFFKLGQEASDEVTFHNGAPGIVHVVASVIAPPGLIDLSPHDAYVRSGEDFKVKITYHPQDLGGTDQGYKMRFLVEPFNQYYYVGIGTVSDVEKYQKALEELSKTKLTK